MKRRRKEREIYKSHWQTGRYVCANCGLALFDSSAKFDCRTPWPAFNSCLPGATKTEMDYSPGYTRLEVRCAVCEAHLGFCFQRCQTLRGPTTPGRFALLHHFICLEVYPAGIELYCLLMAKGLFRVFLALKVFSVPFSWHADLVSASLIGFIGKDHYRPE